MMVGQTVYLTVPVWSLGAIVTVPYLCYTRSHTYSDILHVSACSYCRSRICGAPRGCPCRWVLSLGLICVQPQQPLRTNNSKRF